MWNRLVAAPRAACVPHLSGSAMLLVASVGIGRADFNKPVHQCASRQRAADALGRPFWAIHMRLIGGGHDS